MKIGGKFRSIALNTILARHLYSSFGCRSRVQLYMDSEGAPRPGGGGRTRLFHLN